MCVCFGNAAEYPKLKGSFCSPSSCIKLIYKTPLVSWLMHLKGAKADWKEGGKKFAVQAWTSADFSSLLVPCSYHTGCKYLAVLVCKGPQKAL